MIQVTVNRKDKQITAFSIHGHARSGPYGYDLVCAGVSAVSFGAINAVMTLSEIELEIKQSESGNLQCELIGEKASQQNIRDAQLLLEGMLISLETIERDYGEFIMIIDS